MIPSTSTTLRKPPFFINRNFMRLWTGEVVSRLGDIIFDVTLVLWIATQIARAQPWAPLAVSGILVSAALPTFLIGPIAGVFADRWPNKKLTMMRMDILRAGLILLLILFTGFISPLLSAQAAIFWQLAAIYVIVLLCSTSAQFFEPSASVLFNDIVDEPSRARAAGLMQTASSLSSIAGPPLATLIFFAVGAQWALVINGLSFLASFIVLFTIQLANTADAIEEPQGTGSFWHEFLEGIRFYTGNRVLRAVLITGILVMIWNGAFNALSVFFVTQNLHVPAGFYAYLEAGAGAGLVVGAFLAGLLAQRIGVVRMFWSSILLTGVFVLLYARLTLFFPALGVVFLIGLVMSATTVPTAPLIMHVTPRELLGRVFAVLGPMMSLSSLLAILIAGWLASSVLRDFHISIAGIAFGPLDTILTISGILAILGGIYAKISMRGVELKEEEEHLEVEASSSTAINEQKI